MNSGVYIIENKVTGSLYVGSSIRISKRFLRHKTELRCKTHVNTHLQHAFEKYGEAAFEFRVLEETDKCIEREQHYIDTLNPEYNILRVAGSATGYKQNPAHVAKRAESARGKKASPEARQNMRLAHAGARHHMFGKHLSSETRARIGAANKGRPPSAACIAASRKLREVAVERLCPRTGSIVRYSSSAATEIDGFARSCVRRCCRGEYSQHAGYQWRYAQ
jgi:group I intron endonuclease